MDIIEQTLFGEEYPVKRRLRNEIFSDYDSFVEKFKPKKTTDDCMTPPEVYDAVLSFVRKHWDISGLVRVRPFWPGGDYRRYPYPERCVVIDNPPFSILAGIVRFYCSEGIPFFIFAPALTLFSASDCDVTYIIAAGGIVYENGAKVRTAFITNLPSDLRIWVCPELCSALKVAQKVRKPAKARARISYPDNIVTAATLEKLATRETELCIRKSSCVPMMNADGLDAKGRGLFGGGFLLSSRAAAERAAAERAAAERAAAERAAAERAAAVRFELSEREKEVVALLDSNENVKPASSDAGEKD